MTTNELIQEVGEWADKNFGTVQMGRRIPHYGLLEEVGEIAHCILKHTQKIRGFEVEEFFKKELQDAFADTIIYLADYSYCHRAYFTFNKVDIEASLNYLRSKSEEIIMSQTVQCVGSIINYESQMSLQPEAAEISVYCMLSQRLCSTLEIWAAYYGYNLKDITFLTWSKVSKRDWNKENFKGGE